MGRAGKGACSPDPQVANRRRRHTPGCMDRDSLPGTRPPSPGRPDLRSPGGAGFPCGQKHRGHHRQRSPPPVSTRQDMRWARRAACSQQHAVQERAAPRIFPPRVAVFGSVVVTAASDWCSVAASQRPSVLRLLINAALPALVASVGPAANRDQAAGHLSALPYLAPLLIPRPDQHSPHMRTPSALSALPASATRMHATCMACMPATRRRVCWDPPERRGTSGERAGTRFGGL